MSNPDEPRKKKPQPTVQWDPEDLPPSSDDEEEAEETAVQAEGGEEPPAADSQSTRALTPEEVASIQEGEGGDEGGGDDPPSSQATVAIDPEEIARRAAEAAAEAGEGDDDEEDPLVGTLLRDKWRVLQRLGAGSFGTVYKVRDEAGGWIEALKILGVDRITGSEAETVRKRFLREAQIMKRLGRDSQHIAGLSTYEEDLEGGLIFFLMEFLEGGSLADELHDKGPFDVERTITLALQVCDALMVAHEGAEPVVHRDLKLENLMLTEGRQGEEIVKVLDFGIAKLAEKDADSRLTQAGTLGTPGFAAPEQLRAEEVDARTDLFAFGVILYCLLTGKDPWLGNYATEPTHQIYDLMVATERGEVRPISETGVEVPAAMEHIVMRLLRRDPDERFHSARELKEALERVQAGGAAADVASLRVVTDEDGVDVQIRSGRTVVAEGRTPLVANGLEPGSYRVTLRDDRFEPMETTVSLDAGAIEDLSLVTTPRSGGVGAGVRRRPGLVVSAAVLVLLGAGAVLLQPWGRSLSLAEVEVRAAEGAVTELSVTARGLEGRLSIFGLPAPFTVPLDDADKADAVAELRDAGVAVDATPEVARLQSLAAQAQAALRYFGEGDNDVQAYALRMAELDPDSRAAHSLLLKVGERMAWDAEAALGEGSADRARELVQSCLELVPDHPRCSAVEEAL